MTHDELKRWWEEREKRYALLQEERRREREDRRGKWSRREKEEERERLLVVGLQKRLVKNENEKRKLREEKLLAKWEFGQEKEEPTRAGYDVRPLEDHAARFLEERRELGKLLSEMPEAPKEAVLVEKAKVPPDSSFLKLVEELRAKSETRLAESRKEEEERLAKLRKKEKQ